MIIPSLVTAFILCCIAALLNDENADSLLAGYNTMSKEKKKNVDFPKIVHYLKKRLYTISALLVIIGLLSYFIPNPKISVILFINILILGLTATFGASKYDSNPKKKWEQLFQHSMLLFMIGLALFLSYQIWNLPVEEFKF